jgi:hypothetical protein
MGAFERLDRSKKGAEINSEVDTPVDTANFLLFFEFAPLLP